MVESRRKKSEKKLTRSIGNARKRQNVKQFCYGLADKGSQKATYQGRLTCFDAIKLFQERKTHLQPYHAVLSYNKTDLKLKQSRHPSAIGNFGVFHDQRANIKVSWRILELAVTRVAPLANSGCNHAT